MTEREMEDECGRVAARAVAEAGGFVTFDQYDKIMGNLIFEGKRDSRYLYFAPLSWINGRGDPILHKANNDKLCAFAAVRAGLLLQEDGGYRLTCATDTEW